MTTKPTLAAAAKAAAGEPEAAAKGPPSRRGKKAWVVYLDAPTSRRLKAAAALAGRSLQSFGEEAADWLIGRHDHS